MKKKKIFIVGFGGSGTRVPSMILERAGYYVGGEYLWKMYDPNGKDPNYHELEVYFDDNYFRNDPEPLKKYLEEVIGGRDEWAIKYPHFLFIVPLLKEWYPDAQFIYVLRNPIDVMSHPVHHEFSWAGKMLHTAPIEKKVKFHLETTKMAFEKLDYVVKLEDLLFNSKETISNLLTFANAPTDNVDDYLDLVKMPKTIGRGKEHYEKFKQLKEFDYLKELGYLNE